MLVALLPGILPSTGVCVCTDGFAVVPAAGLVGGHAAGPAAGLAAKLECCCHAKPWKEAWYHCKFNCKSLTVQYSFADAWHPLAILHGCLFFDPGQRMQ